MSANRSRWAASRVGGPGEQVRFSWFQRSSAWRRLTSMSAWWPSDKIAFDRHRLLLILGGEKQASHFCFDRLQGLSALALRMENIATPAHMRAPATVANRMTGHPQVQQS
jgi:hypothetical protein